MEGIMAEHHQQYMRSNPLRMFPDGLEMDPASSAAAAMLTEKARSALGLPPSAFWTGNGQPQQHPVQQQQQRLRNPLESSYQQFMNPSAAAATAAAMSQLYSRGAAAAANGMIPPPHFWSQFYGLNHQLGLLSGLAGGFPSPIAAGTESSCTGSPPPSSSTSPSGFSHQQHHQRYSPYPLNGGKGQLRTPSPRSVAMTVPSSSPK